MTASKAVLHEHLGGLTPGELGLVPEQLADTVPGDCLLSVLGIELTHAGPGAARATMLVSRTHLNQSGIIQGGAVIALADAAAGWATDLAVPADAGFTTLELKANLLSAGRDGDHLVALARPVHLGRTTVVLDVTVMKAEQEDKTQGEQRLTARFTCTQMVLESR